MFMTLTCRRSSILSEIGVVGPESLRPVDFTKIALFGLVYTLAYSFLHQFRSYLHTMSMTIKYWVSSVMK